MGKVSGYSKQELSELQAFKQSNRKLFDSDSNNEKRLSQIKKLKHNYERSRAMLNSILLAGFDESSETVNIIIEKWNRIQFGIRQTAIIKPLIAIHHDIALYYKHEFFDRMIKFNWNGGGCLLRSNGIRRGILHLLDNVFM